MSGVLLLTAAGLLGALAFFEPCTIATHSLFAARSAREPTRRCCRGLLTVWVARTALVSLPLVAAATWLAPPDWSATTQAVVLAGMGAVYLISRLIYLPVPHLEIHRLLPGGSRWPEALRLGLTLPACTLPLFAVVLGTSVTVGSPGLALAAGILFATLFTLPMAIASLTGIHADGQQLLARSARAAPYVTATLLFGAALILLTQEFDLSPANLRAALMHAGWAGLGLSFLAGFVFSFNPISFASIPVVLAYVTKAHEERKAVLLGVAFVAGLVLTHLTLGVAAALGGEWVRAAMGRFWGLLLGPLLVVLGLMWPGWLRLRLPWISTRVRPVQGALGAALLAVPFSVAVCPFCAPALLIALTASAAIGSPTYGAALLLAFALGRSVPILIGAWSMGWLESLRVVSRHRRAFEVLGGVVLIATGAYLLNEYFLWIVWS